MREHCDGMPANEIEQQVIQLVLCASDLEEMSTDEQELVLTYLMQYQFIAEQLRGVRWSTLIHLVDLVPEISGISVHRLKAYREPANNWERFRWEVIGTPRDWRFEIVVHGRPFWRYRIVDTWEEAQEVAKEAQEKFKA